MELFLTAMAACSADDVDFITSRIADPVRFNVTAEGEKCATVPRTTSATSRSRSRVRFPEGADGDRARERLPRAIAQSQDRLCTVSRTVQRGTPIAMHAG